MENAPASARPAPDRHVRMLAGAALGGLGLWLFWRLHFAWMDLPGNEHGWLVPPLLAVVLWRRWTSRPVPNQPAPHGLPLALLALSLGAIAIARPMLEYSPTWPVPLWLLTAGVAVGALGAAFAAGGWTWARHAVLPVVLCATALPWFSAITQPLGNALRPALATIATEVINLLGYPALQNGVVITLAGGQVGMEDACSGLHSLQAATMLALFLGELMCFTAGRRLALLASGWVLALAGNLLRTLLLTWQAARAGQTGVHQWHDPTGTVALLASFGGLAALAWVWRKRSHALKTAVSSGTHTAAPSWRGATGVATGLVASIVALEGAIVWRNRAIDGASPPSVWAIHWPANAPDFRPSALPDATVAILQCEALNGAVWRDHAGHRYEGYLMEWRRNWRSLWTISFHRPDHCMAMVGAELLDQWDAPPLSIGGETAHFTLYRFRQAGGTVAIANGLRSSNGIVTLPGYLSWWRSWGQTRTGTSGGNAITQRMLLSMPDLGERVAIETCLRQTLAPIAAMERAPVVKDQ